MTMYCVAYRPKHGGGAENITRFESMLERTLWIISHTLLVDVVREWIE